MMNTKPLVSVILPCYNAMPFLPMALDSIIHQTYINLEIICINDGSSDETPAVLEAYAKKDNRIRVIHNETNLKLIGTLNKAISIAQGEYIARMDADDVSDLERIEKLLEVLEKENVDIVSCSSEFINMEGKKMSTSILKARTPLEIQFASYFFTPIGHALLLGRKDIFLNNIYSQGENALHTEDYELWTRMIRNNVTMFNHDESLYSIRVNENSVSRQFEEIQKSNFVKSAQKHQEALLNRNLKMEVVQVVVNRMENTTSNSFKAGIHLIDEIFKVFLTKQELTRNEVNLLHFITTTQKTDVAIQALKIGNLSLKFQASFLLLKLIAFNLLNIKYRKYIFSKF